MIFLFLDSIGFGEILLILLVIIVFFGPDKLPEIARGFGQAVRTMREATDDIKREIMEPVKDLDITQQIEEEIDEAKKVVKENTAEIEQSLEDLEGPIKRDF